MSTKDASLPPAAVPFHEGETAVHERYGIRERIDQVGRAVIRDAMPEQHREFFAAQALIFVGSIDAEGRPWASVLGAGPGFLDAGDGRTLDVAALPSQEDPLSRHLAVGSPLGFLGIEFASRRRNRMNGTVTHRRAAGFTVKVDQSFGNCPQYIQARRSEGISGQPSPAKESAESFGAALPPPAAAIVRRSDTMFVASASARAGTGGAGEGVDVSHRGGKPGFVRASAPAGGGPAVLTIPDFRGNFLFNTLGNLISRPRAGLLFVDFATGDLLQMTGLTEIVWEGPEVEAFAGAQRLLRFTLESGVLRAGALRMTWSEPEFASQLAATGSWAPQQS